MKFLTGSNIQPAQKKTAFFLSLSFLMPFLLLASAFIVQGVHPFGSHMILTVDLYHQYAPFAAELRNKILHGESLFFSWNIGLGTNFWAIFANYASSPMNLLLLLFPQRYLSDGIAFIVCLRAGLTGLFFGLLLRDIDHRREDLFLSCFSAMYALCGWVLAYFWNIMWFDAVMLLPLIILGLRYLMRDRKPFLFCISLFICIWSNFYSGFFVCFFLILYAPVCYVSVFQKLTLRNFWSSAWRFGLYSAIAGGMTAALAYPVWLTLKQASATGDPFPKDNTLTQNIFDFLGRFFLTSQPNIRDGMANVYCGVLILLLIPLYFLCTKIRLREKIAYGLIMLFLYFSFADRVLNFIWHGFHFPNQIPYREAFLMSFILVIMAYKVLRNLKSFTIHEISASVVSVLAFIILYEKFGTGKETILQMALTAVFVIAYGVIFRDILTKNKRKFEVQRWILSGIILAELLVATQVTVGLVSMNESFTGWDFYGKKSVEVTNFIDRTQKDGKDGKDGLFVRAEMYPAFISDETALYHVKGLSVFSSTEREKFIIFMKGFGLHNNGINGLRNHGLTEVTASLFGIRYLVALEASASVPGGFTPVPDTGDLTVVRNDSALSVGYMVSPEVLSFVPNNGENPFVYTNEFLQTLGVDSVYGSEVLTQGTLTNAVFASGNGQSGYQYTITSDKIPTEINVNINARFKGSHIYLYLRSAKEATVTVTGTDPVTSQPVSTTQNTRTGQIIDLGTYDPALQQTVKINWSSSPSGQVGLICYSLNDESYKKMITTLSKSQLQVTHLDTTHLTGTIHTDTNGVMLLTIPVDNGWTATVDGKKTSIQNVGSALMAIPISAGDHTVSLTFVPEGFSLGLKVSLASLAVLILISGIPYAMEVRRRIRKGSEIPEDPKTLPEDAQL